MTWNGQPRYIHGANLAWYNFGQGLRRWADRRRGQLAGRRCRSSTRPLAQATAAGMNVVRWWLFPGQPTQFLLDGAGLPTGLRSEVFTDIDAALADGPAQRIAYTFTLFSAPHDLPAAWLTTETAASALALVLGGLFARYRNSRRS